MSDRKKIMAGVLAVILGFMLIIPGILRNTLGDPNYGTINNFERGNPVYEKTVDLGTPWVELGLPDSLRAVLKIADGEITAEIVTNESVTDNAAEDEIPNEETVIDETADDASTEETADNDVLDESETEELATEDSVTDEPDQTASEESEEDNNADEETAEETSEEPAAEEGFRQTIPAGDDINYERYGYVAPENEAELRGSDQLVIYTLENADGSKAYRIYGTFNGENEAFYACDEDGNITGIVVEIPVTWNGVYDADTPDVYILTAQFEGYTYSGEMPTAVITVLQAETEENDNKNPDEPDKADTRPPLRAPARGSYTIDLHSLTANTDGPGWAYTHNNNMITFYGNHVTYGSASGSEYKIVRSVNGISEKSITINADVDNITVRYDGPNINVNPFPSSGTPSYYYRFTSNVTINGGDNNTVIYDGVVNISDSVLIIGSAASNTTVEYRNVSHLYNASDSNRNNLKYTLTNNGANTEVIFDGVKVRSFVFSHYRTGETNAATMYLRGTNTFNMPTGSFETLLAQSAHLKLWLSGSTTSVYVPGTTPVNGGYIVVPANARLTIDSEDKPGSEQGSLSLGRNDSAFVAVIGGYFNGTPGGFTTAVTANSGEIIINGGTVSATQTKTSSSTSSYGAAIGGGDGGIGNVTINGGKVIAKAVDGAGIGGGNGTLGTGNVIINGGTVDATSANGAGIGGGKGGKGNITIHGGNVTAAATIDGAAIGGGMCTGNLSGNGQGNVNIHGGKITATSNMGAAIGGGAASSSSNPPPLVGEGIVFIDGGDMKLKSTGSGACVGNGGSQHNQASGVGWITRGSIVIKGGTIFADFANGTGVGTGNNNSQHPDMWIDAEADIVAFGRNISNTPGIDSEKAYTNKGTGYFVNANFDWKEYVNANSVTDAILVVYNVNAPNVPVRVIPVDFNYREFSFTTGKTYSENFYVYTGTFSGGAKQVICKGEDTDINFNGGKKANPNHTYHTDLFSVKDNDLYYQGGHYVANYWRSMGVRHGIGGNFVFEWPIVEKYVDTDGNIISADTATQIPFGQSYSKTPLPLITGYNARGYRWDTPPGANDPSYTSGDPVNLSVTNGRTIYLVYELKPTEADVTVSKTVTGKYANMTKAFTFTATFKDENGTLLNTGSFLTGDGGTLTVDANGEAVFTLKHGQTFTIKDIPVDYQIEIIEAPDDNYTPSFMDSTGTNYPDENETGFRIVDEGWTFDFTNARKQVPATNINDGNRFMEALLLSSVLLIISGVVIFKITKKRRWPG